MSKNNVKIFFFSLFTSLFFVSCYEWSVPKMEVGDRFFYWESTELSRQFENVPNPMAEYAEMMKHNAEFKPLTDKSITNLRNTLGQKPQYVWVRFSFEIPPAFKGQPLGLVVPRLRFAEQLYCNNTFISKYGDFPPHEQSTWFKAHFFSFPLNILRQDGQNDVYIKIFVQGGSGISSHAFIQPTGYAYANFEVINFHRTRLYIFLVGIMLFTFILYINFYRKLKNFKEYRDFALLNLSTSVMLVPFFATEIPLYTNGHLPFLWFVKCTLCFSSYCTLYFATSFASNFQHTPFSKRVEYIRLGILAVQIVVTALIPTYSGLIRILPFMLVLLAVQGGFAAVQVVRNARRPQVRHLAVQFGVAFLPLTFCALVDIFVRWYDNTQAYPVFSLFGWQFSIIIFIIVLATRFAHVYRNNEQLSNHLQEEVANRTQDLQHVNHELAQLNEHLEDEKFKADMDLQMASLVQQRFFPQPNKQFRGWDIAVYYSPSAIVSGDLYDYYNFNDDLNGIALFDVSGHGISASLVTMLAKNIISHQFQKGFRTKEPIDSILAKINNILLSEKGDIDNYLTGILCRFETNADSDIYKVELGNAGHPYPLKYSAQDNEIFELRGNDGKKHYGAIGMQGIAISFAKSDFVMAEGDVLICYTDGLTEALNAEMEQFGSERVKQLIKENNTLSANELLKLIIKNHSAFTKGKQLDDDITIMIAKRTNPRDFVSDDSEDEQVEEEIVELLPVEE